MSAPRYLLDTNIVSDLVRNPRGVAYRRIREIEDGAVCTSIIVVCELKYGVLKRGSRSLLTQLEAVLGSLPTLPFETHLDRYYARIRAGLEAAGRPIGPNDLFIAAHAVGLGLTLVTHNTRKFERIPDLKVEDWLA